MAILANSSSIYPPKESIFFNVNLSQLLTAFNSNLISSEGHVSKYSNYALKALRISYGIIHMRKNEGLVTIKEQSEFSCFQIEFLDVRNESLKPISVLYL